MTNYESYAKAVKDFSKEYAKINSEFSAVEEKIRKYSGSAGYEEDLKRAEQDRQAKITELKKQTAEKLNAALAGMRTHVETLKMVPPSADVVNILRVLQMRERLTESEIRTAYQSCKESGVAVAMLQELARKHGIVISLRSDNLDGSTAGNLVETLAKSAQNFVSGKGHVANYRIAESLSEAEIMARMACIPLKVDESQGLNRSRYDTEAAEALSKLVG